MRNVFAALLSGVCLLAVGSPGYGGQGDDPARQQSNNSSIQAIPSGGAMDEGLTFVRYDKRPMTVAVFRKKICDRDCEIVLDLQSLENRIENLKAAGFRAPVSSSALSRWPKED
jgi:hypothetical protein